MIDKKILQEKNLQDEMMSDEELEKVSGGQSYENPSSGWSTGNNDEPKNEFPTRNGGH